MDQDATKAGSDLSRKQVRIEMRSDSPEQYANSFAEIDWRLVAFILIYKKTGVQAFALTI